MRFRGCVSFRPFQSSIFQEVFSVFQELMLSLPSYTGGQDAGHRSRVPQQRQKLVAGRHAWRCSGCALFFLFSLPLAPEEGRTGQEEWRGRREQGEGGQTVWLNKA
jgi:hypothetical protein